jgi:hypothetical protein
MIFYSEICIKESLECCLAHVKMDSMETRIVAIGSGSGVMLSLHQYAANDSPNLGRTLCSHL